MSEKKPPRFGEVNEGIQASSVTAEVLAVGRNARAYKKSRDESGEVAKAFDQLRLALEALKLQPPAQAAVLEDLASLHAVAESKQPEPERAGQVLQNLAGKLKMVGVVLADVVALSEPLRSIAGFLRVPLHMLGL